MSRATLIDLSKWNVSWDPSKAQRHIDGAILRAGYGGNPDGLFHEFAAVAQEVHLRGCYWYFSSALEWGDQADKFLNLIEGKNMHFLVGDFERPYNEMNVSFALEFREFLEYLRSHVTIPVIMYTNPDVYQNVLVHSGDWMNRWKLWLAQYPYRGWNDYVARIPTDTGINPWLPKTRTNWSIWQYSADGNLQGANYGVGSNSVDLNVANGTVDDLIADLGLTVIDVPDGGTPPDLGNGYTLLEETLNKMDNVVADARGKMP